MEEQFPTDQKSKSLNFSKYSFLGLAILGSILFYFFGKSMLGGLGLSGSLFGLVSFFHFLRLTDRRSEHIDTNQSWFFLALMALGFILLFLNYFQGGYEFYYGIAGGIIFIGGLSYCMELILTWLDSVR